ncbi:MAG: PIN domain-containing protein [Candidatus Sericytochromatia bacterium]|nr:PIN domain-containing protein [Candidatus Tanganyikabacteria bacterium]
MQLPITAEHTLEVALLPQIHKNPYDRILVAQARIERMTLVTRDDTVLRYPVATPRA